MTSSLAAVIGALALAVFAIPPASLASCVMIPDLPTAINRSEVVFVGTVTSTEGDGRWATVSVEEVWRGPDQRATVVVVGAVEPTAITSIDRTFDVGARYLFVPDVGPNGSLTDNACSSTARWEDAMIRLRPANARAPLGTVAADGSGLGSILVPIGVALAVAVALLLVGLAARSRQAA